MSNFISALPISGLTITSTTSFVGEFLCHRAGSKKLKEYGCTFFRTIQTVFTTTALMQGCKVLYPSIAPAAGAFGITFSVVPLVNLLVQNSSLSDRAKGIVNGFDCAAGHVIKSTCLVLPVSLLCQKLFAENVAQLVGRAFLIPLSAGATFSSLGLAAEFLSQKVNLVEYKKVIGVVSKVFQTISATAALCGLAMIKGDVLLRPVLGGALCSLTVALAICVPITEKFMESRKIFNSKNGEESSRTLVIGSAACLLVNLASKVINCVVAYRLFERTQSPFIPVIAMSLFSANILSYIDQVLDSQVEESIEV